MSEEQLRVDVGLVAFNRQTLLIMGGSDGLKEFAKMILARETIISKEGGFLTPWNRLRILISPSSDKSDLSGDQFDMRWRVSMEDSIKIHDKAVALALTRKPGHQYLDFEGNKLGLDVLLSMGEYDVSVFS